MRGVQCMHTNLEKNSTAMKKAANLKGSDLSDLVDLSGFSDMNEKFEQLLLLEENTKSAAEPLLPNNDCSTAKSLFQGERDIFQPLLNLNGKEKNATFPVREVNKTNNSTLEAANTFESLIFIDKREEPLIKIETN